MHVLLTDETNIRPSKDIRFFIYGGLIFPIEALSVLDMGIAKIRAKAGFKPQDVLKFATSTRPNHLTAEEHTEAKREVVNLCLSTNCKFIAHIIHHDIIKNQDQDQQLHWAANLVIGRYNQFLREALDNGICIVDNLPVTKQFRYLSEKFTQGLMLKGGQTVRLDRIKLFGATCINASHASSAMDIVLGSFRYCINDPANINAAREMMRQVVKMMWYRKVGNTYYVGGRGLIIRPPLKTLSENYPKFKPEYDQMIDSIKGLLKEVENEARDN
jgi:hypothetical protein